MSVKVKKRAPSQDVTCELCQAVVKARGLKTHLRNIHKSLLEETREVKSVAINNTTDGSTVIVEQVAVKRYYHRCELCYRCGKGHDELKSIFVNQVLRSYCPSCMDKIIKKK